MNKISTAVVTTILALAVATPASSTADYADDASDAGTVTGGDVTAPEDRLPIDAEMAAKITESLKLGASLPAAPDPFPNAQRVFAHTTSGFQKFVQTNGIVY